VSQLSGTATEHVSDNATKHVSGTATEHVRLSSATLLQGMSVSGIVQPALSSGLLQLVAGAVLGQPRVQEDASPSQLCSPTLCVRNARSAQTEGDT
jgi:hypothetical protein